MLDMQWMKERFESTRKAATDDADSDSEIHQLKGPDSRAVYSQWKIGDLPSIRIETEWINA
jgi:hypothetical protein